MNQKPINRRNFLIVGSSSVASLLIGCSEKSRFKPTPTDTMGQQTTSPAVHASITEKPATPPADPVGCSNTTPDITGPYWREGIPVRNGFDLYGHTGQKLALSGFVRNARCEPIANAVIEMWHATPTMVPANALSRSDSVDYDTSSPNFRYYGQFATDAQGAYSMTTLKPGWYLNGSAFRPSHIHVKVYVGGIERLTTQLYFKGDPFIAGDHWASAAPKRAVELIATGKNALSGSFDFTV